jgi:SAM-dependent methyltransferase
MENRLLYRQDQLPIFQNRMYDTEDEAVDCPRGDVRLVENETTGLVYNAAFRPELMVYDEHYQNEQAVSEPFRVHLNAVAELVLARMGRDDIIEVGCGKGYFLELLARQGVGITGFDPTYEGDNPRIRKTYFDASQKMSGKGLILRHVLEHVQDPVTFLRAIKDANGGSGYIYIEVPCLDWIIDRRAWFDIYYEHVNYFRLSDFGRMFGRVIHAENTFGGQYLSVIADLSTLRDPEIDTADRVAFPEDFMASIPVDAPSSEMVVWGGASKGVIFALLCARAGRPITSVIDINPAKQGRHIGGTGLQVKSPESALADVPLGAKIYVMNPNYLAEIKSISNNSYNYVAV